MIQNNGYPGLYIVFEGIIGTGKSTQIRFLKEKFAGRSDVVFPREPGGTPESERIRDIVKSRRHTPLGEARLFAEARRSTIGKVILPALAERKLVIADRSIISSLAYQGFGRQVTFNRVWEINRKLIARIPIPDCVLYFELPIHIAQERSGMANVDKFDAEGLKFWCGVLRGYELALKSINKENSQMKVIHLYDGNGDLSPEAVHELLWRKLEPIVRDWERIREGKIVRERER